MRSSCRGSASAQRYSVTWRETTYIGRHRFNTRYWKTRERKPEAEVVEMAVPPIIDAAESRPCRRCSRHGDLDWFRGVTAKPMSDYSCRVIHVSLLMRGRGLTGLDIP